MGFVGFLFASIGGALVLFTTPAFVYYGNATAAVGAFFVGMNMVVSGATLSYVALIWEELRRQRDARKLDDREDPA